MNRVMATANVFMALAMTAEARIQPADGVDTVHVYVINQPTFGQAAILAGAQECATRLLAQSGVALVWHHGAAPAAGPDVLNIRFTVTLPAYRTPERETALALAQPYAPDGTPMLFFTDRIAHLLTSDTRINMRILGHVLAHEICHVLEGMCRHSAVGLMKARWTSQDFSTMSYTELSMADEDRLLVRIGIGTRMARAASIPADSTR